MKKVTIDVFEYHELGERAKEKALNNYRENLVIDIKELLVEMIEEEMIKLGFSCENIKPLYSLNYCQGDGLMFEGVVFNEKEKYRIKHSGRYYHEQSKEIVGLDDGDYEDFEIETEKFDEQVYVPVCQKVRDYGYSLIKYEESEECFIEYCEANDVKFTEDGNVFNN